MYFRRRVNPGFYDRQEDCTWGEAPSSLDFVFGVGAAGSVLSMTAQSSDWSFGLLSNKPARSSHLKNIESHRLIP